MEKRGTLGQKRRPKEDPKSQKGPLGDPGPLKETQLGTVNKGKVQHKDYRHGKWHSLIISREGLILTLSILPCPQGRIC